MREVTGMERGDCTGAMATSRRLRAGGVGGMSALGMPRSVIALLSLTIACASQGGTVGSDGGNTTSPDGSSGSGGTGGGAPNVGGSGGGTGGANGSGGIPGSGGLAVASGGSGGGATSSGGVSAGSGGVSASGGTGGHASHTGGAGGQASATGGSGAGAVGGSGASAGAGGIVEVPAGWIPGIVAVGYGGLRIVSRDGGMTWGDRVYTAANGGDNNNLIRAAVYGKGMWLASGWNFFTSTDGTQWVDHGPLKKTALPDCSVVEGLAYNAGYFYAACAPSMGVMYRSTDGLTWSKYSTIGDTGGHTYVTYQGGMFIAYGDTHTAFVSSDGMTWTTLAGIKDPTYCQGAIKNATDCHSAAWFDSFWLQPVWQGTIARSTDGNKFTNVYSDDQMNTVYQSRSFVMGYVAPK